MVINDVLEHVPYNIAPGLLSEASRSISGDGVIYVSVANRWEIQEPHFLIPFLTWFPPSMRDAVLHIFGKGEVRYNENFFPYTPNKVRGLFEENNINCKDYTWFYARDKIFQTHLIGSIFLRSIVRTLKKIRLTRITLWLARRTSVILFLSSNVEATNRGSYKDHKS